MQKKSKLVLIISIVLIVLGPILGFLFDKLTLYNQTVIISDDSYTDMTEAYDFQLNIQKDQKIIIEFSVHYLNVTAYLKICGKGYYDAEYLAGTNTNNLNGENFVYSEFTYGRSPHDYPSVATSTDEVSIEEDGYYYIEFAGATTLGYLRSIPGPYVIVIYGTNDGGPNWNDVIFNVTIKIDGPGEFLELILVLIGMIALVATILLLSYSYLRKTRRGLL